MAREGGLRKIIKIIRKGFSKLHWGVCHPVESIGVKNLRNKESLENCKKKSAHPLVFSPFRRLL